MAIEQYSQCGACAYYQQRAEECHRHAPAARASGDRYERAYWPTTAPHDWCGDFEVKKKPEQKT
jgi:hypothetical protein